MTAEHPIIEAMAEAICHRRNAGDWPCNGRDFDVEMARAALRALYDHGPTPDMLEAGWEASKKAWRTDPDSECTMFHRAMLAAVLNPPPTAKE